MEAKRMLLESTQHPHRKEDRRQLKRYFLNTKKTFGHVQTMYGAVGIGKLVCFYRMNVQDNPYGNLIPLANGHILHIDQNGSSIHTVLSIISNSTTT